MPASFTSAGGRLNLPGIPRSPSSSSSSSAIALPKAIPASSPKCVRSGRTTWPSSPTRKPSAARFPLPMPVEAVNGQLEILRRNSGGYFQSEESLKLKLWLVVSSLEQGRWRSPGRSICTALPQLNAMFQSFNLASRPRHDPSKHNFLDKCRIASSATSPLPHARRLLRHGP